MRNKTLFSFVMLLMLTLSSQLRAAENEPKQAIGLYGGFAAGNGLTYVRYVGPHMLQASFTGSVQSWATDMQFSLAYSRYVHKVKSPRSLWPTGLKLMAGGLVNYQDGEVGSRLIQYDAGITAGTEGVYFYRLGAGFGFDIGSPGMQGITVSLSMLYTLSLEEFNNDYQWQLEPLPGIGILYSW